MYDAEGRLDLKSLTREELERWFVEGLGEKRFRALQVYKWIWQRGISDFAEMTNVSKDLRALLAERAYLCTLSERLVQRSSDGTAKYLWGLEDGYAVESVLIPEEDRITLCVSSQVGCAMGCRFCLTGDMGLVRHLKPSEIVNQVAQINAELPEDRRITNLVFMGMGEPLHNLEHLDTSLQILLDDDALNFSHRKITVSTSGLVPQIGKLAERTPVNLAISLNASTEAQRREIMPITERYSMASVIEAARNYPLGSGKRITFEYVMFKDFNDSLEDAARLYRLLRGIKAKVNLIPYNENPSRDYRKPDAQTVKAFQNYFVSRGLNCSVRSTRGDDISAACGQLGREASGVGG
ncbi:MAG: 23S rRNA (adenine(2503)-C(2))-methyltransferase RlmN [Deltaproteobacteria bacterium]|nr:23S rRNA (adenine(2503)-C(2))-methyltransferase RlmN [Deltaproteobacteria bacterium]